jgi:hypothetical protein
MPRRRTRMDMHENARSCPASRELLVDRVLKLGWSVGLVITFGLFLFVGVSY